MIGLASGILGGLQSAYGIYQDIKGSKMARDNKRPDYEIPEEISQNLTQAQQLALEGLPSEQKQQYLNNIQRTQQFGLNSISDRKGGLAGIGSIVQSGNDANMNLLSADAGARLANQKTLMNARSTMAGYKDKAFELNKLNPYQERATAARSLQGAGLQNIFSGLGTIAGVTDRNQINNGYAKDNSAANGLSDMYDNLPY